jgi:hypothetical protein
MFVWDYQLDQSAIQRYFFSKKNQPDFSLSKQTLRSFLNHLVLSSMCYRLKFRCPLFFPTKLWTWFCMLLFYCQQCVPRVSVPSTVKIIASHTSVPVIQTINFIKHYSRTLLIYERPHQPNETRWNLQWNWFVLFSHTFKDLLCLISQ